MKFKIDNKFLYVTQASSEEMQWLDKKLTWSYNNNEAPDDKLLIRGEDKTYTFWGMYNLLKTHANCPFDMEIENYTPPVPDTSVTIDPNILPSITLLGFQCSAVRKSVMLKKGISSIPTGGGKTEIILAVIRYLLNSGKAKNITVVVPSVGLGEQFLERAFLRGFTDNEISVMHGNARFRPTPVVVAVINSINIAMDKDNEAGQYFKNTDCLIYDEAHHASATSYMRVAIDTNPEYLLMYSASPFNSKNIMESASNVLLFGLTGNIINTVTQKYLRDLGLIAEPIIYYKTIPGRMGRFGQYNDVYENNIVKHLSRNETIFNYTRKFVGMGFKTLILVQRIEHAKILMTLLKDFKITCIFGGGQGLQLDEFGLVEEYKVDYNMFRSNFEAGAWDIVIGSQVIDEGFHIPSISCVILAGGGKSRIKLLQRVGRGLRRKKVGRNQVYIVDFHDRTHKYLQSQYIKRKDLMKEIEATIIDTEIEFFTIAAQHSAELREINGLREEK